MVRKMLVIVLVMIVFLRGNQMVFGYTEEEQYAYDNLYLQLPWEPAKHIILTQENRDTPTHMIDSVDEYALDFGLSSNTPVAAAAPGVAYVYKVGISHILDRILLLADVMQYESEKIQTAR
jgi:hypothetical protein